MEKLMEESALSVYHLSVRRSKSRRRSRGITSHLKFILCSEATFSILPIHSVSVYAVL